MLDEPPWQGADTPAVHLAVAPICLRLSLGAEMIGPAGEHLAHLMSWALQRKLTIFEMLRMPFYHPTIEEGLRAALRDAARKAKRTPREKI